MATQLKRGARNRKSRLPKLAYGIDEIAEALSLSESFVRLEIGRGRFKTIHAGRRVLVTKDSFDEYLVAANG